MFNEELLEEYSRLSGSSFYYAMMMFPQERRQAVMTVYSFCRFTDDIVDGAFPGLDADEFLRGWRNQFDLGLDGRSSFSFLNQLGRVVHQFSISPGLFHDLIDGFEMDLTKRTYENFSELYDYCYRVASTVGLMVLRILDNRNSALDAYAINAGIGVQLTNITRDVLTDFRRGRIYVPQEDLRAAGLEASRWLEAGHTLNDLLAKQCKRARSFYDAADFIFEKEGSRGLYPARAMQNLYRSLLVKMERHLPSIPYRKIRLSMPEKLRSVAGTWLRESLRDRAA